jgi:hypothetical protein
MKKVMFAMLIVAGSLASAVSFAQDHKGGDPAERAKKISEKLKTELSLNNDQYNKVYDINLKYGTKMHDLKKAEGDRDSKMTEMKTISKSKNDELKAVLTDAQWTKYTEWKKEQKHHVKDKQKETKNG